MISNYSSLERLERIIVWATEFSKNLSYSMPDKWGVEKYYIFTKISLDDRSSDNFSTNQPNFSLIKIIRFSITQL